MAVQKKKKWKGVIWLLLLFSLVYMGVQIWRGTQKSFETQIALPVTVRDSITAQGVVVRNETLLQQEVQGVASFTVSDAERVSAGREVALIFADAAAAQSYAKKQQIDSHITLLQQAQEDARNAGTDVSLLLRQLRSDIGEYISLLRTGSFANIEKIQDAMSYSFNKLDIAVENESDFEALIASLKEQSDVLAAQSVAATPVYTPLSGYFCYAADGIEALSPETLTTYMPTQLQALLAQENQPTASATFGKIVSKSEWSFFCVLSQAEAARLTVNQKVTLRISEIGADDLPGRVSFMGEPDENGDTVVAICCNRMDAEVSTLRFETVEIILASYTGARIPRSALHLSENGEYGVLIKYGTIVKFCYIEPLYEQNQFLVVALDKEVKDLEDGSVDERAGLLRYDEIIISGKDIYKGKLL